jgi:hypothetical protein
MRAVLPHQIRQRRRSRRARGERRPVRAIAPESGAPAAVALTRATDDAADTSGPVTDAAARRVRAAGGPLDSASYTCGCGCVFAAAVTTSVVCPHCGDAQAW